MKKMMMLIGAALFGAVQAWGATVECSTWAEVRANLLAGNDVKLANDMTVDATNAEVSGKRTLDMNGKVVSVPSSVRAFCLQGSQQLTVTGNGTFTRSGTGSYGYSGCVFGLGSSSKLIFMNGTISNLTCSDSTGGGGAVCVANSATFEMNGGTISGCSATGVGGGAVYVQDSTATFIMNGGTITNCTASATSGLGGAVYNAGTFTMNAGTIAGCKSEHFGGAIYHNSGSCTVNGGRICGNNAAQNVGAIFVHAGTATVFGGEICDNVCNEAGAIGADGGTTTIYGGVMTGNVVKSRSGDAYKNLFSYAGTMSVQGLVSDAEPSVANIRSNNGTVTVGAYQKVGDNWVVGKSIVSDANNQLTAGTYTFNPTNAEYVAAGVVDKATTCVTGSGTAFNLTHATEELIVNGNFENRTPTTSYAGVDTASAPGWTFLLRAGIENDDSFTWAATHPGGAAAYIQSVTADTGSIQQSVAVTEAGDYAWSFDVAARPNFGNPLVTLTIGDQTLYSSFVSDTAWATVRGNCHLEPGTYVVKFTASWTDKTSGSHCASIDNVSLAKVCAVDCSTWAQLKANLEAGNSVKLAQDIEQGTLERVCMESNQTVTLDLNGFKISCSTSASDYNRPFTVGPGHFTLTDTKGGGVVDGLNVDHIKGSLIWIRSGGASFTMNGGVITNFYSSQEGGAVSVFSDSFFTMNGGMIASCTTASNGGAVYVNSTATFTMNGGTITGCKAVNGGAVYVNGGTFKMYNGTLSGCSVVTGNGGGVYVKGSNSAYFYMYGGVIQCSTTAGYGHAVYSDASGYAILYGGVSGTNWNNFTNVKCADGYSSTTVGSVCVIGKSIVSDANNQLTAGTYTFNPTNAEYVAAGVAVKEGKFINAATAVTPKTWTISDYETKADPSSTYKPTQIVNGGFDQAPWMDYVLNGTYYDGTTKSMEVTTGTASSTIPNGVDGGWNTSTKIVQCNAVFDYQNSTMSTGYFKESTTSRWIYNWNPESQNTQMTKALLDARGGFIECNGAEAATLYQDLTTCGGDVVRWSFLHGVRYDKHASDVQPMTVYIGAPNGTPSNTDPAIVAATQGKYYSTNGSDGHAEGDGRAYGNADEIKYLYLTKSANATKFYETAGVYVVPEGQSVTRFAFQSNAEKPAGGNWMDDVTFSTLIGNLRALLNDDGSVTITGYWGDSDTTKKLMVKIGDSTADAIDMSSVLNTNFTITVSSEKIGSANQLEVYHQDYESAKRTVVIGWAVTLNLNAADATCAKLTEYQRGVVTVLPIPTRRGYAFDGWFTNSVLTGTAVTSIPADATGAKEFWAKWSEPLIQVGDDAWARIKGGVCTITGTSSTWDFTNKVVNPLATSWALITNVVVTSGVTGIGANMFDGWSSIRDVSFGADCTNIASQAFLECWNLTNVAFAATGAASIGDHAFYRCNSLEKMSFVAKPTFGVQSYTLQAGIWMKDGLPQVYTIPDITVGAINKRVLATNSLAGEWTDVTDKSDEERKAYHFFKIVIE